MIEVSTKQLSKFFGITNRGVALWAKNGCPKLSRGHWDLKIVHEWWLENIYESRADASDESIQAVKRENWVLKNEKLKKQLAEMDGALVKREDIADMWRSRVIEVKSGLLALESRLPRVLLGKDEVEMRQVIKDEVRRLLSAYSRDERYCPDGEK